MGDLLGQVLPLALGAMVSPTILAAVVVVLASKTKALARGAMFVFGTVVVLAGYTLLGLTALSNATAHATPTSRRIAGGVDFVLGFVLLTFAARELLMKRPPSPDPADDTHAPRGTGVWAAFALGAVMMLTNFTSLVLYLPALQDVHRSRADDAAKVVAVLVLFLFTALPALVPLGARAVAPGPSQRVLHRLGTFMTVHKRGVTATVSTLFGVYLLVRGLGKL